jgi:hypothetical protein
MITAMKTLSFFLLGFALFATITTAEAQSLKQPNEGYWVIETNLREAPYTIVRMYSNQHVLLYEERLEGKRLNAKKSRHVRLLNAGLTNVLKNTVLAQKGLQGGNLLEMIAKL